MLKQACQSSKLSPQQILLFRFLFEKQLIHWLLTWLDPAHTGFKIR